MGPRPAVAPSLFLSAFDLRDIEARARETGYAANRWQAEPSVMRACNHLWTFRFCACAALAVLGACHRDVTSDLAFACRSDADCHAGWLCDGICRPRAAPDALASDTSGHDALPESVDSVTADAPETASSACPSASFRWTRTQVPGFTVPAKAGDFVANGLDDVWAVSGGRVHRYDPDGRATAIGPDLGATGGIVFAPAGGVLVAATETRSLQWVTASGQSLGVVVGLSHPAGLALTQRDSVAIVDASGAIFEAPTAPPASADPAIATPTTSGLYAPSHVSDSPDGLRRFSASAFAGVVWAQTWTGSGWSAPTTFATLPGIIAPPELATCTTPAEPCFTATGLSGVCASDAGRVWCRADPTAPDPRVSSPGVGIGLEMSGAIICTLGAPTMPCNVAFAGIGLTGTCTDDRYCRLEPRDVYDGCAPEELGDACVLVVNVRQEPPAIANDRDADGLSDARELASGTDPDDHDSDADGVTDGAEPGWCLDDDHDGRINARDDDANGDGLGDGAALGSPVPWLGVCVARERLENSPDMPTAIPCVPPVAPLVGRGVIAGLAVSDCGDVYFTELPQGTGAAVLWRASADGAHLAQVLSSARGDPALGPIHWVVAGNPPRGALLGVDTQAGGLVAIDVTAPPP